MDYESISVKSRSILRYDSLECHASRGVYAHWLNNLFTSVMAQELFVRGSQRPSRHPACSSHSHDFVRLPDVFCIVASHFHVHVIPTRQILRSCAPALFAALALWQHCLRQINQGDQVSGIRTTRCGLSGTLLRGVLLLYHCASC